MKDPVKPARLQIEAKIQANSNTQTGSQPGPVAKLFAALFAAAFLVAALFLSVFIVAGLAIVAVIAGIWLWWRTRRVRREFGAALDEAEKKMAAHREQATAQPGTRRADIIDGDYIRAKSAESAESRAADGEPTDRNRQP